MSEGNAQSRSARRRVLAIGAITGLGCALLSLTGLFDRLEASTLDVRFRALAARQRSSRR